VLARFFVTFARAVLKESRWKQGIQGIQKSPQRQAVLEAPLEICNLYDAKLSRVGKDKGSLRLFKKRGWGGQP
jgi:hypothetical protein